MAGDLDVVVIGAGAAGLAAGRAAQAAGLAFRVIEAKSRTGGRAYTDYDSFGVPFDHGCHWLHSRTGRPCTHRLTGALRTLPGARRQPHFRMPPRQ